MVTWINRPIERQGAEATPHGGEGGGWKHGTFAAKVFFVTQQVKFYNFYLF